MIKLEQLQSWGVESSFGRGNTTPTEGGGRFAIKPATGGVDRGMFGVGGIFTGAGGEGEGIVGGFQEKIVRWSFSSIMRCNFILTIFPHA